MTPNADELLDRLVGWLRTQGVPMTEKVMRHAMGIVKSLETEKKPKG